MIAGLQGSRKKYSFAEIYTLPNPLVKTGISMHILRKSYINREPQETDFKNYGPVISVYWCLLSSVFLKFICGFYRNPGEKSSRQKPRLLNAKGKAHDNTCWRVNDVYQTLPTIQPPGEEITCCLSCKKYREQSNAIPILQKHIIYIYTSFNDHRLYTLW